MTGPRVGYVLAATAGGTGRHVAMLARGCAEAGAVVRVFGPPGIADLPWLEPVAIGTRPRPARDAAAVRRLRREFMVFGPDVVHAHGLRAGALAALALALTPGRAVPALVVTVHNAPPGAGTVPWAEGAPGTGSVPGTGTVPLAGLARAARAVRAGGAGLVYLLLERIVAARADVVLCVSADLAERMRRLGAREVGKALVPAPVQVPVPAAAPVTALAAPPATGPAVGGRPVVFAAGRLAPQKGFDTLIAAAALWRGRNPRPRLVIAGSGPLAPRLTAQARAAGEDTALVGELADVPAWLAAADVVVVPSRWEGQPMIVQEALRAARPVVATDVGGIREVTGDEAALLVPPGDPAELAAAVLRVLGDPELAARLAAAALARAAALPTEAGAITAALAVYRKLAQGRLATPQ